MKQKIVDVGRSPFNGRYFIRLACGHEITRSRLSQDTEMLDCPQCKKSQQPDVLKPELAVLAKLSAVVVHLEEWLAADSHPNDRLALEAVLCDPEVQAWVRGMEALALAPLKRGKDE